jgi:hypothetical protein
VVRTVGFRWLEGEDLLGRYRSSANVTKTFCKVCGSSLITIYPNRPDILGLPIAGAGGELDRHQEFHIFVGSKARWWRISDSLPQYREAPEDDTLLHCIDG